jgi:hypothetical protein
MNPPFLLLVLVGIAFGASRSLNVESIADTAWRVTGNGEKYEEYTLRADGSLAYWNRSTYFENVGVWRQTGKVIHFEVNNRYAEYDGTFDEGSMALSARNINGLEWTETLERTTHACGAVGAAVLAAHLGKSIESVTAFIGKKPLDITWGEERYFAWDSRALPLNKDKPACILKLEADTENVVVSSDIQGYPCSCASLAAGVVP